MLLALLPALDGIVHDGVDLRRSLRIRLSKQKRAAKRANPVPIATGNTQYDMTQASYHWARASALNLMGLAALNLPKGIASL